LPGQAWELLKQVAVIAEEDAQAFGDGPHELVVGHVEADVFGDVEAKKKRAFLGATGADASLLAGKSDEELVAAVGTTNAGEAILEVAAFEELADGLVDHRPPVAALAGVAVGVDGAEIIKVFADQAVEVGFGGLSWAVDADRLAEETGHVDSLLRNERASLRGKSVRTMLGYCSGGVWSSNALHGFRGIAVVPLPAGAWTGLTLLGALSVRSVVRRKLRAV